MERFLLGVWLVTLIVFLGLLFTRRVIVAWWSYWSLRKRPEFRTPEGRALLLQFTKDYADGKTKP